MRIWRGAWKAGAAALVVLFLLALSSIWLLPWLIRQQIVPLATQSLGRSVTVQQLDFKPWRMELTLRGLQVAGAAPGDAPLLEVERLAANLSLSSLWHRAPVIDALTLDQPLLRLARTAVGHYSIDDLLQRLQAGPPPGPDDRPAQFALYNLQLRDGRLLLDDRPAGRTHELGQLKLDLPFLSNLDTHIKVKVQPRLAGVLNGVAFDSGAIATPFDQRKETSLKLHLDALDLRPYLGYLPKGLPVKLLQGHVTTDLELDFAQADKAAPQISLRGRLQLSDWALAHADDQPWLEWKRLNLSLKDLQPLRQLARFGELQWEAPRMSLLRMRSGGLKLPGVGAQATAAPPADKAAPGWQLSLDRFALQQGALHWRDQAGGPGAALNVDELALELKGLAYPLAAEADLQLSGRLASAAKAAAAAAEFKAQGQIRPASAQIEAQLQGLQLAWLAPYLQQATPLKLQGQLGVQARVSWMQAAGGEAKLGLEIQRANLDNFQALDGTAPALGLKRLELVDTHVDLATRQLQIGALSLKSPSARLERAGSGGWNVERWAAAPPASAASTATSAPASAPWAVQLTTLRVEDGRLAFSDAQAGDGVDDVPVRYLVDGLRLELQDLNIGGKAGAMAPLRLQARLGALRPGQATAAASDTGSLDWRGSLGLQPLAAKGSLRLDRLPIQGLDGYLERELLLSLQHGDLGYRGDFAVSLAAGQGLQASAEGDVLVADLKLSQRHTGEDLLSWQALNLKGLKLALLPGAAPRLDIAELSLSDFFARLAVSEQGRFNLGEVRVVHEAAPVAQAASEPAAAATPALLLSVASTKLLKGRVDFSDQFVRPNYRADITNLQGSLGAFRSDSTEMAALELRGTVAGTAALEVSGRLNPSAQPLMLDIAAKASDLELAPLTPYAAKYAGYAIERGKLSMDLNYRIQADGKLEASNQVILNQLTFGERVDSPEATKLPVLLAVALLKDSSGVIDVRLPVSGSVNDPQFSVSGIVLKLILNLLGKALTSPFSLLMGGGGPDLSYAEFLPGSAVLSEQGQATLAKVAKALQDRPGLSMTVTGAADPQSERDAIQAADLEQRLLAERRRELQRAQTAAGAAAAQQEPSLTPGDRERLLRVLYKNSDIPGRPRNLVGLLKDLPLPETEAMLKARHLVTAESARALALARGVAVRDALIASGLPNARLFLAAPTLRAAAEDDANWTPRVVLSLEKH
ncbi:MAG: DUF748 domain-containing protein [Burkholderiaceae bacterium]|nr:DUF748 domain-containing protein [Burkholderiaceae bacterium]